MKVAFTLRWYTYAIDLKFHYIRSTIECFYGLATQIKTLEWTCFEVSLNLLSYIFKTSNRQPQLTVLNYHNSDNYNITALTILSGFRVFLQHFVFFLPSLPPVAKAFFPVIFLFLQERSSLTQLFFKIVLKFLRNSFSK